LDIISIITTLLDIHWFYNSIIESVGGGKVNSLEDLMKRNESKVTLAIKVFKIIRIIRIVRITKLYITIEKIILKIKRNYEEKERRKNEEEERRKKEEEEESKKRARLFMEEYIKNALSEKLLPKKNVVNFLKKIMKKAIIKCQENNMNPSSPKKLVNVIAKNFGIDFNKKENNKIINEENKSEKSDESKECSLVENKQTIEINIGKDENDFNISQKRVSESNFNENEISYLKRTFMSAEVEENSDINKILLKKIKIILKKKKK
jgi:hypothetical protein